MSWLAVSVSAPSSVAVTVIGVGLFGGGAGRRGVVCFPRARRIVLRDGSQRAQTGGNGDCGGVVAFDRLPNAPVELSGWRCRLLGCCGGRQS